jgi:hypothetical protein
MPLRWSKQQILRIASQPALVPVYSDRSEPPAIQHSAQGEKLGAQTANQAL